MNFPFDESQDEFNLSLYPSKCKKFNQSEWRIRRREITTFARDLMRELSMVSGRDISKRGKRSRLSKTQKCLKWIFSWSDGDWGYPIQEFSIQVKQIMLKKSRGTDPVLLSMKVSNRLWIWFSSNPCSLNKRIVLPYKLKNPCFMSQRSVIQSISPNIIPTNSWVRVNRIFTDKSLALF